MRARSCTPRSRSPASGRGSCGGGSGEPLRSVDACSGHVVHGVLAMGQIPLVGVGVVKTHALFVVSPVGLRAAPFCLEIGLVTLMHGRPLSAMLGVEGSPLRLMAFMELLERAVGLAITLVLSRAQLRRRPLSASWLLARVASLLIGLMGVSGLSLGGLLLVGLACVADLLFGHHLPP